MKKSATIATTLLAWLAIMAFGSSSEARAQNVLLLAAEGTGEYLEDVRSKLANSGEVEGEVISIAATQTTPSLDDLSEFDAVLVWSNSRFLDRTLVGNTLADYVDQGGLVVEMTFSFHTADIGLAGRWRTDGYSVFVEGNQASGTRLTLDQVLVPGHPLFEDVESFDGGSSSYHHSSTEVTDGAELLARYSNGTVFAAINETSFEGTVIGLNFFPPSSDARSDFWEASSDGVRLMINALHYDAKASHRHVCIEEAGSVRCWGANESGQLGLGTKELVGDDLAEMGDRLAAVDLGPDFEVAKVLTGGASSCAASTNGKLKCWGNNGLGQLGLGDTLHRGDDPGEMGAALPAVDLGPGFLVADFAMGAGHVCALSSDGLLKCFGHNGSGQLGLGDKEGRGDGPGGNGRAFAERRSRRYPGEACSFGQ